MTDLDPTEDRRTEEERRRELPGRRDSDEDRAMVAHLVRTELHAQRKRWLVVWLLTLMLSVIAWRIADSANDRVSKQVDASTRQAEAAERSASKAQAQARVNCSRILLVAPDLVADYEERGVLSGRKLEAYRSLIPKRC